MIDEKQVTMKEKIENNFRYHSPKASQTEKYKAIRDLAKGFAIFIDEVCPDSREKSLSITNLEQAVMWANASIARNDDSDKNSEVQLTFEKTLK